MAHVYILYSEILDKYYVGSCLNLQERISEHLNKRYECSFTAKVNDWELYFSIDELGYLQARKTEQHIKKMKSRKFIEHLKKYPELVERLLLKYK